MLFGVQSIALKFSPFMVKKNGVKPIRQAIFVDRTVVKFSKKSDQHRGRGRVSARGILIPLQLV